MPNSMQYNQGYVSPPLLDMTFDECAKVLRRMELLTYHSVVSTLRAQGSLTPQKHKLLKDLAALLDIPIERHKAEVRLAVNHEELCTIAHHMEGPNTGLGWQIEGARTVPLPPRPPPLTKYKLIADRAAEIAMKINAERTSNPDVISHPTLRREHSRKCKCDKEEASQEKELFKAVLLNNTKSEKCKSVIPEDETGLSASKPCSAGNWSSSPTVVGPEKIDQDVIIENEKLIKNETVKLMPPPPPPPPLSPALVPVPQLPLTPPSSLPQSSVTVQTTTCTAVCTQTLTTATVTTSMVAQSSASLLTTSSTLMLPSGMSIQLREDDMEKGKKRKRSVSQDLQNTLDGSLPQKRVSTKAVTKNSGSASVAQNSSRSVTFQAPIKISLNTPVITRNNLTSTVAPSSATQKVIIVSNASAVTTPSILHKSLSVPVIRATHPRLQKPSMPGGIMAASVGSGKIRPKMVTIPAKCRSRANSIVIPVSAAAQNIQLKTALTLKQDGLAVDHNMKRVPIPGVPGATKILPKPSTMFVVNPTTAAVNVSKATLPSTSRLISVHSNMTQEVTPTCIESSTVTTVNSITSDSTVITKPPPKSNVVILQKTPTTQGLTLTAANKEMISKVFSGKNIITQTGRPVVSLPKNFIQKTLVPSIPVTTAPAGSVIVLDLSQDNVSRNLNLTEILQASGIIPSVSTPHAVQATTVVATAVDTQQEQRRQQQHQQLQKEDQQQLQQQEQEDQCEIESETETNLFISKSTEDWLEVGTTDDSKTFTVEEVNLPYNAEDGETVVTFEEAVELLNESEPSEETHIETVETIETIEGSSEEEQIEVAVIEEDQNDETQVFSVQAGDLAAGDIAFIADKNIDLNSESVTSQIVIETVTEDKEDDMSSQICEFLPHVDDSVDMDQTEIQTFHLDMEENVPHQIDIHSNL